MRATHLKILILTHRFFPDVGGIETNSEILATAFINYGAEVHVLTWTKYEGRETFPFTVIRSPRLGKLLKEHRWADVVFENNPCLRLSWVNLLIRRPLVIALNTWVNRVRGNKGTRDRLKNMWFRRAASVIAVSEAIKKKEWSNAIVIENPYNNKLFERIQGLERSTPFIFLGRLVSDKGVEQAIKAIAALSEKQLIDKDRLQLTIIGDGPERKNLVLMREKLGLEATIHFTGVLQGKQLVDCLNKHRFILVPSVWEEPYGNVVLEGMACGCIPIASDGGGLPEAVGNAGFLFKRNNETDLINLLEKVLVNKQLPENILYRSEAHLASHTTDFVSSHYFNVLTAAAKMQ